MMTKSEVLHAILEINDALAVFGQQPVERLTVKEAAALEHIREAKKQLDSRLQEIRQREAK